MENIAMTGVLNTKRVYGVGCVMFALGSFAYICIFFEFIDLLFFKHRSSLEESAQFFSHIFRLIAYLLLTFLVAMFGVWLRDIAKEPRTFLFGRKGETEPTDSSQSIKYIISIFAAVIFILLSPRFFIGLSHEVSVIGDYTIQLLLLSFILTIFYGCVLYTYKKKILKLQIHIV